jgi:hypothetical protein
MPRALRTGALIALAIAIPVVVASATYLIGVRSLAPATRLQVNVAKQAAEHATPSTGRSSVDDHGGSTPGRGGSSVGTDDHGGTSSGTSGGSGSGSSPGGGSSPSGEDHHGGKSGSDDGGKSGSGGGGSGGSGSGGSGSDDHSGHGGGGGGGDD